MNDSAISLLVSMQSLQNKIDIIANNIANLNTTGYKQKDANFEDVLTSTMKQPKAFIQKGRATPAGFTQGWGSTLSSTTLDMSEGPLKTTNIPTDLAIKGNGLIEISIRSKDTLGNNIQRPAWTRDGSFELTPYNANNLALATKDGNYVQDVSGQPILIPNHSKFIIDEAGRVFAKDKTDPQAVSQQVGQIKLVQVLRPDLLKNLGDNVYVVPSGSNNTSGNIVQAYDPTQQAVGQSKITVHSGMLEQSNVDLSKQMSQLIEMQRAYQFNARAITTADTMSNLANHLQG